ncbi:MAG: CerR family C-terminal domain-containing protein [Alphaproteobacteria bacterium]
MDGSDSNGRGRGHDRGAETRDQLIDAALRLFAIHGYHGVSTRMVTKEAGANLAAINYHFGGKQGLYEAVIDNIAVNMGRLIGPIANQVREAIDSAGNDRQAIATAVHEFCLGFITALVGETSRRPMVGLVMREFSVPTEDFSVLFDKAIEPLHKTLSAIVAASCGEDPTDTNVIMRAHALLGMCISFAIARAVLCRRMDWQDYTPARVAAIGEAVASVMLPALGLPQLSKEPANG